MEIIEQLQGDIDYVKSILPEHYEVKVTQKKEKSFGLRCTSSTGIRYKIFAYSDDHWEYLVKVIRSYFGERYYEIDHITNFCHVDFIIYLKYP